MFYDKEVSIYKIQSSKSNIGEVIESDIFYKNIKADIQSVATEEVRKKYGDSIKCSKRMFCNIEDIKINYTVKYKDVSYKVVKIIEFDDLPPFTAYLEVLLDG